MLITNLKTGAKVLDHLFTKPWVALDTETVPITKIRKKDALIFGRARIVVWSACHRGESYSFVTERFSSKYPAMAEWACLLKPYLVSPFTLKVFHNANYDLNVFYHEGMPRCRPYWDTMIAGWLAAEWKEKGLKSRAPIYGRYLNETKTVSFSDLDALAHYAEQDVVQTDEMFQMQRFGFIDRPAQVTSLKESGSSFSLVTLPCELPSGKIIPDDESLTDFQRLFIRAQELPVLASVVRAERYGVAFDYSKIQLKKAMEDLKACASKIATWAGKAINPNSNAQVAKFITDTLGIELERKTKKGADSVGIDSLLPIQDKHPAIPYVINYRKIQKLISNYMGSNGLISYVADDGRIHCTLNSVGAVTSRMSSQSPNLQNQPSRNDRYLIKGAYTKFDIVVKSATYKMLMIVLDFGQVELRVMGRRSCDPRICKVLNDPNGDLHQDTADTFGVSRSPVAKQLNFLLQYGGGPYALMMNLLREGVWITMDQAQVHIERYDEVSPAVKEYRLSLLEQHKLTGHVTYATGRTRHVPDINWDSKYSVHSAETTLANNTIQGDAQDLLKAAIVRTDYISGFGANPDKYILENKHRVPAMTKLHEDFLKNTSEILDRVRKKYLSKIKYYRPRWVLQVHDENLFYAEESVAVEIAQDVAGLMTWDSYFPIAVKPYTHVALTAEGGIGESWAHAKSKAPLYHVSSGFGKVKVEKHK